LKTNTISVDPEHPEPDPIDKAAGVVLAGGIIAFPTDTTYGLGVNPFDDSAVSKVYRLKQRQQEKPLILLLSSQEQLENITQEVSEEAKKLMEHFWPGPLTLIFAASDELKSFSIGHTGKIGIRIPDNPIARKLIDACRIPLTATSANISGQPSARSAQDAIDYFGNKIEMVLDGGPSRKEMESTVIDLTISPINLIREGQIGLDRIETVIGHSL
jgi:L-threonylcarbamoyladenylate synthase